jgi:NAD(P)-dependent dehydrogenase (short-subunit alcohol dehydrogenase family)
MIRNIIISIGYHKNQKEMLMLKDNTFKEKTIIITGGGSGLGRSMTKKLSSLGANVVIVSRKMEVLQKTADEISEITGNIVTPYQLDVRQYKDIVKVIDKISTKFGNIDGLINNAAGNFISPTEYLSHKAFDIIVDIVLRGTYNFTLALGKQWIEQKQAASILNIVTTYASTGSGYVVPSAISKAGVLNLTRSLAAEWGKYNIRLNAIAPGPFPTKGAWERLMPNTSFEKKMINRIPLKRVGEHEELANLASYLLSSYSAYITGEVITIDGGEWLAGAGEFNFLQELTPQQWQTMKDKMKR